MSDWLLFDPMFRVPFLTGLLLAIALSLIGALLRMRDEWLAALGLSQIAAVGAIAANVLHLPLLIGAFGAAGIVMILRAALPRIGNSHYGMMIILGWSGTLLLGSYIDHGHIVGEHLLRGQLYFTHTAHLSGAAVLLLLTLTIFPWLSPRLLTARFFPDYHKANRLPVMPYSLAFALLVIGAVVTGTVSIGAFPAFAMLFVPPWVGFVLVHGWVRSLAASAAVGCSAYITAFIAAILLDLPFGPVLTAVLILCGALRFVTALRRRNFQISNDQSKANYLPLREDHAAEKRSL